MSGIYLEIDDHVSMSTEEYTKRYNESKRADLISKAIAMLKLAAHIGSQPANYYEGEAA